jgi:hypothetical protein
LHAARQQKALARIDAASPPARGISKRSAEIPLAHPPNRLRRKESFMACGSKELSFFLTAKVLPMCLDRSVTYVPGCSR